MHVVAICFFLVRLAAILKVLLYQLMRCQHGGNDEKCGNDHAPIQESLVSHRCYPFRRMSLK